MRLPLSYRLQCVEAARRIACGGARAPARGEERDDLAQGLAAAVAALRWAETEGAGVGLPAAEGVSFAEQARCVGLALRIVTGAARAPARAAERDYLGQGLEAAAATLQWLVAHEYEIRAARRPAQKSAVAESAAAGGGTSPAVTDARRSARGRPFPLATRAAMRCAEKSFQTFLGVDGASAAAVELRARCGVASRKQFDTEEAARERWRALDGRYAAWLACVEGESGATGGGP